MNIETSKPVKRPRGRPRKRPTPATPTDESRIFKKAFKEIDNNGFVVQDNKGVRQLGNEREEHVTIVRDGNQESGVVIDTSILSNQNLIKQQRIINDNSSLFTCDGIPMGEGVGDGQNIYQQMSTMSQESGSNPYNDSHAISNNAARSQFDIEESLYNEAQHNGLAGSQSIRNFDGSQHQFSEDVQDQYEGGSQRTESDPGHYPGNSQDQFIGGGLNEQNTYANNSDMTSNQGGGGDTFTRRGSEENSRSRRPSNRKSNENSQLQARAGKEYEQLNNCQFPPTSHAMDATPFVSEDSQSVYNQMWFSGQNRPMDSGFVGEPMPLHYPQVPQPMMSDGNPYQQHYTMEGGVLTPRVDGFGATDFSRAGQNLSNMYYMAPNEGVQFPVDGSSANMMMHENMNIALPSSFYPAVSSLQSRPASETTKPDEILTAEEVEAFKERESRKEKQPRIKRPRNAFLVWATPRRKALAEKHPGMNNADISVKLGEMWRAMTNADKQPFYDEAARIKAQHKKDHPEWCYQPKPKKKRLGQGTTWVYAITENPRGGRHINYINTYNNYDGNMSIGNMNMNSMNMGMMMGNQAAATAGTGSTGPPTSLPPGMLHMPQMHHPMQTGPPPSLYLNKPSTSESGPTTTADSGSTNEPIDIVSDSPTPNDTDTVEQQASPEPIPA